MNKLRFAFLFMQLCCARAALNDDKEATKVLESCGDIDGNGETSTTEMLTFLTSDSSFDKLLENAGGIDTFLRKLFIRRDLDKNGYLSKNETDNDVEIYLKTLNDCLDSREITELSSEKPRSNLEATMMFKCYDVNGNGKVHKPEVVEFYTNRREQYHGMFRLVGGFEKFADRWITTFDSDGDKSISEQEYLNVTKVYLHMIEQCHKKKKQKQ